MNPTLQKAILEETYLDFQPVISDLTKKFRNKYGGKLDEITAEANYLFVEALVSFDKNRCPYLLKRIGFYIWYSLHSSLVKQRKHPHTSILPEIVHNTPTQLFEILDTLPEDCVYILKLVMDPTIIRAIASDYNTRLHKLKGVLKYHLKSIGWTPKRICISLSEIKRILKS